MAGLTIPNAPVGSGTELLAQGTPDSVDFDILVAGIARWGVLVGCAVTASGASMQLAVAAGAIVIDGVQVAVAAATPTVGAAPASGQQRFDLVVVNNVGVVSITAGTAALPADATHSGPVFPAVPANSVVLAAVYVGTSVTTIGSADLVDKRVFVTEEGPTTTAPQSDVKFDTGDFMIVPSGVPFVIPAGVAVAVGAGSVLQIGGDQGIAPDNVTLEMNLATVRAKNSMPRGVVGTPATVTAMQTNIGTAITDITGLAVTATLTAGRYYKVTFKVYGTIGTTAVGPGTSIRDGSNNVLSEWAPDVNMAGASSFTAFDSLYYTGSGATTFKVSITFFTNTNNQAGGKSSTEPAWLIVEDIGGT